MISLFSAQTIMASISRVQNFLHRPYKNFFFLWLPVLFSMLAEPLTGLVDTAFISQLGPEALAALGVGTVILTSGMWLFNFLSVGSQTEMSQASGQKQLDQGKRFGSLALIFATIIGLALTITAVIFAPALATIMGASDIVHDHAVTYIRFRAFGSPAVLITMTSFGILYGLADMRSPLLIAITVNALNILLDGLLIFGAGPVPAMGVAGAAIASTISQWSGVFLCGYSVHRRMGFTSQVKINDVKKLLNIGRDMFIRTGLLTLFLLLATRSATKLGADAGAAHQAVRQVWVFTNLFLDASAITAQSIIGYYFGSGNIFNARKIAKMVSYLSIMIGIALMTVMLSGTSLIAAILVPPSALFLFYPAWKISAILQPVAALAFITDGIHWGTGDFRFLRNAVFFATLLSIVGLLLMELSNSSSLTVIWWIIGGWVVIRSGLGTLRIWPGTSGSPLRITHHNQPHVE